MQRSSKFFPQETWYYYTFYNSYDDEQREYRYERHTKQVERVPSKQSLDGTLLCQQTIPKYFMKNDTFIRKNLTDSSVIVSETIEGVEDHSANVLHTCSRTANTMISILEDQQHPQLQIFKNYASNQLEAMVKGELFQKLTYSHKFSQDIIRYFSCQYERMLYIITSPNVATGMLLSNLILLWLVLSKQYISNRR